MIQLSCSHITLLTDIKQSLEAHFDNASKRLVKNKLHLDVNKTTFMLYGTHQRIGIADKMSEHAAK